MPKGCIPLHNTWKFTSQVTRLLILTSHNLSFWLWWGQRNYEEKKAKNWSCWSKKLNAPTSWRIENKGEKTDFLGVWLERMIGWKISRTQVFPLLASRRKPLFFFSFFLFFWFNETWNFFFNFFFWAWFFLINLGDCFFFF